jgi:hypothetical protein
MNWSGAAGLQELRPSTVDIRHHREITGAQSRIQADGGTAERLALGICTYALTQDPRSIL